MVTTGLSAFLIEVALALAALAGTVALLWAWFFWLAGKAEWGPRAGTVSRPRSRPPIGSGARIKSDPGPPSASPAARAEIAELELLWELSRGRSDPPRAGGLEE